MKGNKTKNKEKQKLLSNQLENTLGKNDTKPEQRVQAQNHFKMILKLKA